MKYCENCFEENLKHYIVDSLGSIFCSDSCFSDSLEHRNLSKENIKIVSDVELTKDILNNAIIKALKDVYDIDFKGLNDELQYSISLEHEYFNLLEQFEDYIDSVIKQNKIENEE